MDETARQNALRALQRASTAATTAAPPATRPLTESSGPPRVGRPCPACGQPMS